jgi:hypothetical protein
MGQLASNGKGHDGFLYLTVNTIKIKILAYLTVI